MSFNNWFNRGISTFNVPVLDTDGILKAKGNIISLSNISGTANLQTANTLSGNEYITILQDNITRKVTTQELVRQLDDVINVKDYGAVGNGVADDTSAIQSAVSAAASAGGGVVYFPKGTYKVTSTISILTSGIYLTGDGWNTVITRSTDYGNTFFFNGNDSTSVVISEVGLSNLTLKSTGLTTSGSHIHLRGVTRSIFSNIYVLNGFIGMTFEAATAIYISKFYLVFNNLYGGVVTGRKYFLFTSGTQYAKPDCGDVFVTDFNLRGSSSSLCDIGLEIQSADGLWFSNGHVQWTTDTNILFNANQTQSIGLVFFNNVMSDASNGDGIGFRGNTTIGRNIQFVNSSIKGGAIALKGISTSSNAKFNNVQFDNCTISEFLNHGIYLNSIDIKNFTFTACQVRGNDYGNSSTYDGFHLAACDKVQITGGQSGGHNVSPGTASQRYGIYVGASATNVLIDGIDLRKNVTKSLFLDPSSLSTVSIDNIKTDDSANIISASTVTIPNAGKYFSIVGSNNISTLALSYEREIVLTFQSGLTVTNGANLKLNGNFTTNTDSTLSLVCDKSFWREKSRSLGSINWTSGSSSPEGNVTAAIGSIYTRTDGGVGTTLYVKETGTGNTGWVLSTNGTVNVKSFGAKGNGVSDDTSAIQAALNYAVTNSKTLFFPSGTYLISSTLSITGRFMICGEGSNSTIKTTNDSIPLIEVNINTTTVNWPFIGNIHFSGPISTNPASCAIKFSGDNVSYIQHGIFENIFCTEFNAFVKDEKSPRTTVSGLEAMLNWNIWSNIQIYNTSSYGFWFTKGSGTGNTWNNIKSILRGAGAATWFFEGDGCVSGDVIIEGAHLGGRDTVTGSTGIKVGANVEYKSRWSITNSQFDANCNIPLDLSSIGGDEGTNWKFVNNNIGGNAVLGNTVPCMSQTIIEDKDVDLRQTGRRIATGSTGALSTNCFDIGLNPYGSSIITVKANGLIGGVAAAASEYSFHISTNGTVMTITEIESMVTNSGQLTWDCTSVDANTARLKVNYTPSSTGTDLSVVAIARGHKHKLTRV